MSAIKTLALALFAIICFAGAAYASSSVDEALPDLMRRQIIDVVPEDRDEYITREDFFVMLSKAALCRELKALTFDGIGSAVFEDEDIIGTENYYHIMHLFSRDILRGSMIDGSLYIQPHAPITRQDAAILMGRWLGLSTDGNIRATVRLADDSSISADARSIIYQLFNMRAITGYPDGSFKPSRNLSFSEASVWIYRALKNNQPELSTYFGSGIIGNEDGMDFEARFAVPSGICIDNYGDLIVFDTYNASVKLITGNYSETILGFSNAVDDYGMARPLYAEGDSGAALFGRPMAGVYNQNDDLFIVDSDNNAIRLFRDGMVSTYAGGIRGFADGKNSKFNNPTAIAIDNDGTLYVADTQNHCIRMILPDGIVETIAGSPEKSGFSDGSADTALFCEPSGIAVAEDGVLYIADTGNHVIRKLEGGVVTTIAGIVTGIDDETGYRTGGYINGNARSAEFRFPRGLCYVDGVLLIADTGNHSVRALIINADVVSTVAGSGDVGDLDGPPGVSLMNKPTSVAYSGGVLYIADSINNKIKIVSFN